MNKRTRLGRQFNGKMMQERRKMLDLTYQELADKVGAAKSYMFDLCVHTKLEPSGSMVFGISKALKCKMEDFYK